MGDIVILVEDNPVVRTSVRRTLETLGYRVRTARNGEEGLRLMSGGYLAVLSDVDMPVMDGYGLLTSASRLGHDLSRIVFMTGSESGSVQMIRDSGLPVLRKPFRTEALGDAIKRAAGTA